MDMTLLKSQINDWIKEFNRNNKELAIEAQFISKLVDHIIFMGIRMNFLEQMENEESSAEQILDSLKNFGEDRDVTKRAAHRMIKKLAQYRSKDREYILNSTGFDIKRYADTKDENTNKYHISPLNTIVIDTLQNLRIYEKVIRKQIAYSKKVSNEQFIQLYNEYDKLFSSVINDLISNKLSNDDFMLKYMNYFEFQNKMPLEWFYTFAEYVDNNKIDESEYFKAIKYVEHILKINDFVCAIPNNWIYLQLTMIPKAYSDNDYSAYQKMFYLNLVTVLCIDNINLTIYLKEMEQSYIVEFLKKDYILLQTFNRSKEWTNKRIKAVRKIVREFIPDDEYDSVK